MALRSAWELQRYLAPVSRACRSSMSSRTPRGKPVKPVDLISLSGPTITEPTRRPLSLLQWAIWWASIMKRWSQVLENIECPRSKRPCTPTFPSVGHAPCRHRVGRPTSLRSRRSRQVTDWSRLYQPPNRAEEKRGCRRGCRGLGHDLEARRDAREGASAAG